MSDVHWQREEKLYYYINAEQLERAELYLNIWLSNCFYLTIIKMLTYILNCVLHAPCRAVPVHCRMSSMKCTHNVGQKNRRMTMETLLWRNIHPRRATYEWRQQSRLEHCRTAMEITTIPWEWVIQTISNNWTLSKNIHEEIRKFHYTMTWSKWLEKCSVLKKKDTIFMYIYLYVYKRKTFNIINKAVVNQSRTLFWVDVNSNETWKSPFCASFKSLVAGFHAKDKEVEFVKRRKSIVWSKPKSPAGFHSKLLCLIIFHWYLSVV